MQPNNHARQLKYSRLALPAWLYVSACLLAPITPLVIDITGFLREESAVDALQSSSIYTSFELVFLAVLTFPLGLLGVVMCICLLVTGLLTPAEALAVSAVVFALSGLCSGIGCYLGGLVEVQRLFKLQLNNHLPIGVLLPEQSLRHAIH
jgi:hypothetical protein